MIELVGALTVAGLVVITLAMMFGPERHGPWRG